jgi:hypothetical protein
MKLTPEQYEELEQLILDFDDWVWCECGECKRDASSHAINTWESLKRLAEEIKNSVG